MTKKERKNPISHCLERLKGLNKVNSDGEALIFSSIYICVFVSPASPRRRLSTFLRSQASLFEFVFLQLGKWQPRRQTGALHHAAPRGLWHKTNGSGRVAPPLSTCLVSCGVAAMLRRGICSVSTSPQHPATHQSPQTCTETRRLK